LEAEEGYFQGVQVGSNCTWFGEPTPCSRYTILAICGGIFTGIDFMISLVLLIVFAGWIRNIKQRHRWYAAKRPTS
jgi:hypothetical protein